ncbi:MAG: exodeoxyribonuclease V subunit alpha [Nocardioidaceae bacterium]
MTAPATDARDVQQVHGADGLLARFNRAGVLGASDVHVARRLNRLGGEDDERVLLAAALVVRAVRQGSVCLDVARVTGTTAVDGLSDDDIAALPWPEADAWVAAVEASPLVAVGTDVPVDRPLRWVDGLLYLDRYWRQEQVIARYVDAAMTQPVAAPDADRLRHALARLFPGAEPDRQRLAAVVAAHRRLSILAGGPGTGKTTTVAKILAVLQDQVAGRLRVALAAPTGKAAARLQEAANTAATALDAQDRARLGELKPSTLHRLLGSKPGARTRFWHDRDNRLPYDVVVVDEASMVSLTMMARLVDALRSDCRLLLVGDPDQLASVEVGAVLGDLVERSVTSPPVQAAQRETLAGVDLTALTVEERNRAVSAGVVRLARVHRFSEEIQALADAIRSGVPDTVLDVVARDSPYIEFVEADPATMPDPAALRADVVSAGRDLVDAARAGDADQALAALGQHRVLCGHREGPHGVARWGSRVEEWLAETIEGYGQEGPWYIGRPLLVTANDYQLRLFNGDSGVVIELDGHHPRAAFRRDGVAATLPTSRLSEVQTVHAMSIHRSQGSQFDRVTVVLPPAESPLLTRELLYTSVTRAKEHVRIIGTRDALAAAVTRPIVRASGLGSRH